MQHPSTCAAYVSAHLTSDNQEHKHDPSTHQKAGKYLEESSSVMNQHQSCLLCFPQHTNKELDKHVRQTKPSQHLNNIFTLGNTAVQHLQQ